MSNHYPAVRPLSFTPWFPNTARPSNPGVYEVMSADGNPSRCVSNWDGSAWSFRSLIADPVNFDTDPDQNRTWRGVVGD